MKYLEFFNEYQIAGVTNKGKGVIYRLKYRLYLLEMGLIETSNIVEHL